MKHFADDNIYMAQMVQFFFDSVDKIVLKGENAGYQHFPLFPQCFQKVASPGLLKVGIVQESVKETTVDTRYFKSFGP